MAQSSSPISGVAERYAGSLYELAAQAKAVSQVEADLGRFEALLAGSADLTRMIRSPVFSSDEQIFVEASNVAHQEQQQKELAAAKQRAEAEEQELRRSLALIGHGLSVNRGRLGDVIPMG